MPLIVPTNALAVSTLIVVHQATNGQQSCGGGARADILCYVMLLMDSKCPSWVGATHLPTPIRGKKKRSSSSLKTTIPGARCVPRRS